MDWISVKSAFKPRPYETVAMWIRHDTYIGPASGWWSAHYKCFTLVMGEDEYGDSITHWAYCKGPE